MSTCHRVTFRAVQMSTCHQVAFGVFSLGFVVATQVKECVAKLGHKLLLHGGGVTGPCVRRRQSWSTTPIMQVVELESHDARRHTLTADTSTVLHETASDISSVVDSPEWQAGSTARRGTNKRHASPRDPPAVAPVQRGVRTAPSVAGQCRFFSFTRSPCRSIRYRIGCRGVVSSNIVTYSLVIRPPDAQENPSCIPRLDRQGVVDIVQVSWGSIDHERVRWVHLRFVRFVPCTHVGMRF